MTLLITITISLLYARSGDSSYCTAACLTKFQKVIIGTSDDNDQAYRQFRTLCHAVKHWDTCIKSCSNDNAKAVFLSSMEQWKKFCAVMQNNEYLYCEREYRQQVKRNCEVYLPPTYSVAIFCKSLEKYRNCSDRYKYRCSDAALQIKNEIEEAVQNSFSKLIRLAGNRIRLPDKCNMWQNNHRHRGKHVRGEVLHRTNLLITTTPTLTTTTTTTTESPGSCVNCNCVDAKCDTTLEESYTTAEILDTSNSELLIKSYPHVSIHHIIGIILFIYLY
ncbi:unnamed protein product [Caenorhabditis bovis]|uniref:DUF19 domain-containing protein n=1 Tax=Caenorhabditis bovis TaxID=2654633 RepID=A0A8S1E8A0_9PELO|nr:unnamed protein product [Caenorhabditis bovis]